MLATRAGAESNLFFWAKAVLYGACYSLMKAYAAEHMAKFNSMKGAEEDRFSELLLFMQLLINITNRGHYVSLAKLLWPQRAFSRTLIVVHTPSTVTLSLFTCRVP